MGHFAVAGVEARTHGTSTSQGVLLVDIRYSSLEQLFGGITTGRGGYFYMISGNGEILYHPRRCSFRHSGWVQENNGRAAGYSDGNHEEIFAGKKRTGAGQHDRLHGLARWSG